MHNEIQSYHNKQTDADKQICEKLYTEITKALPDAENKIWHAHPVWFLDGNPIVGYSKLKDSVRLLFWSGQSFDDDYLKPEGSFKAAEARFNDLNEINSDALQRCLEKSKTIQWDYKNLVKRKGKLERLL